MVAGPAIADGAHTRPNLLSIHHWKTKGRGASRLAKNTDTEIADALALAVAANRDRPCPLWLGRGATACRFRDPDSH